MEWETMKLEGEGPVRHLVFNRPQVHNAVNRRFLRDIVQACLHIETLPDCRVVIVRGAGPSFCSGADLKEGLTPEGQLAAATLAETMGRAKDGARAIQALGDVQPITIAAVHGNAIGGGAMLAMACDFRIAAAGAKLSVREVSLGISLSWQSIPNVVNLVGPSKAKEMILFGETYDAATLERYGVYDQVVAAEALLPAAHALAGKVLRQAPLPVAMTKASINAYVRALDKAVFHADAAGLTLTARSQDAATAQEAFFAKKPGQWVGE
jgi:enoyl-CoA hydratase/carnithine racemase